MHIIKAEFPLVRSVTKSLSITEAETYIHFEHDGVVYVLRIPKHFIFDGASIPRMLWSVLGLAPHGAMDGPALSHDFVYQYKGVIPLGYYFIDMGKGVLLQCIHVFERDIADLLLEALCVHFKVCGKFKAGLVYYGVSAFGWAAWKRNDVDRKEVLLLHEMSEVCPTN